MFLCFGSKKTKTRTHVTYTHYLGDWILAIVIFAASTALSLIHGFFREFSLTDTSIQHTFATKERVPDWLLYVLSIGVPLVSLSLVNIAFIRNLWDWHHSTLSLAMSISIARFFTQIVKVSVGRPRPDLIDRCQPVSGAHDAEPFGLVTSAICTQTDFAILKDGFVSFFSGHSSLSFGGLGVLSWYLAGKLHLFDSKRGQAYATWVFIAPLSVALMVAISRTMDNRHHWEDVLTGTLVGLATSIYSYRQYYPPLTDPDCNVALGGSERRGQGSNDKRLGGWKGLSSEQDREPLTGV